MLLLQALFIGKWGNWAAHALIVEIFLAIARVVPSCPFKKGSQLGGNLIPGGSHSFKKEVRDLNDGYHRQLSGLPVDIRLETVATPEMIKNLDADAVALATGSEPLEIHLSGNDAPKVLGCLEALAAPNEIGQTMMLIGGGLVGCKMALEYAQAGKNVTVVEALPHILSSGIPNPIPNRQMIPDLFEKYGVAVLESRKFTDRRNGKVILEEGHGGILV